MGIEIEYDRCSQVFTLQSGNKIIYLSWEDMLELSGYVLAMKEWKSIIDGEAK